MGEPSGNGRLYPESYTDFTWNPRRGAETRLDLKGRILHVPPMNVFVTGTDTGVGKTFVTCLILKALRQRGIDAVGYKPVSCGDRDDGRALAKASGDLPLDEVNPSHLKNGVAPYVAGLLESQTPDPGAWVAGYRRLAENHQTVVVEGVGGWEVPLAPSYRVSDLAVDLGLPVLLVAANRLGALNHTLLTANAIRSRGLCCLGIVLNQLSDEMDTAMITNKSVIEDLTGLPLLEHLILDQDFSSDSLIDTLVRVSP